MLQILFHCTDSVGFAVAIAAVVGIVVLVAMAVAVVRLFGPWRCLEPR